MLDLRIPSGVFFALAGATLFVRGILLPDARAPLTPLNVNLYAGLSMIAVGGLLLLLAWKRSL